MQANDKIFEVLQILHFGPLEEGSESSAICKWTQVLLLIATNPQKVYFPLLLISSYQPA